MFSNTYTPDSMSTEDESTMFAEQMSSLNQITSDSCEENFDTLPNDAEVPDEVMKTLQTRDVLE